MLDIEYSLRDIIADLKYPFNGGGSKLGSFSLDLVMESITMGVGDK